ncbi:glutamate racemase [Bradyrhizobium sp. USDA 4523]
MFDSGLGGLTVLREIVRARPDAHYVYVADDAFFPYGHHGEDEIIARVVPLVGELIAAHAPDLVVIACNTASTLVMSHLRDAYPLPFVGTVPAIKPACASSKTKRVSVLGTRGTVKREYTRKLISDFAQGCEVTLVGSGELASLAEAALSGASVRDEDIAAELARPASSAMAPTTPPAPTPSCSPARIIRCCWNASGGSRPGRSTGSIRRRRSHAASPTCSALPATRATRPAPR